MRTVRLALCTAACVEASSFAACLAPAWWEKQLWTLSRILDRHEWRRWRGLRRRRRGARESEAERVPAWDAVWRDDGFFHPPDHDPRRWQLRNDSRRLEENSCPDADGICCSLCKDDLTRVSQRARLLFPLALARSLYEERQSK